MAQFILVKTDFERGGARFCGVRAIGSYDTLQLAQDAAEEFFRNYWFDEEAEFTGIFWVDSEDNLATGVDFPDNSDFSQYTIDQVDA